MCKVSQILSPSFQWLFSFFLLQPPKCIVPFFPPRNKNRLSPAASDSASDASYSSFQSDFKAIQRELGPQPSMAGLGLPK